MTNLKRRASRTAISVERWVFNGKRNKNDDEMLSSEQVIHGISLSIPLLRPLFYPQQTGNNNGIPIKPPSHPQPFARSPPSGLLFVSCLRASRPLFPRVAARKWQTNERQGVQRRRPSPWQCDVTIDVLNSTVRFREIRSPHTVRETDDENAMPMIEFSSYRILWNTYT